jgi:hypothetical protein
MESLGKFVSLSDGSAGERERSVSRQISKYLFFLKSRGQGNTRFTDQFPFVVPELCTTLQDFEVLSL